jgi:DNA-binding transcriptional LysR family regulator
MLFSDASISRLQWMPNMQLSDRIGRRMKLHDLHVLMAVVQAGSMSKAAQILNTTQPAVSRSIADLEYAIGVRPLDRGRHGVEPTEYGRALLNGGNAMFDDLRQAIKNIEFIADPTVGEVRIGAPDPLIVGLIPAVFEHLHRRFPGISIRLTPILQNVQQYHDLRERKLDLLLGPITSPVQDDIDAEILFHDSIKIVAGPGSKWASRRKVDLAELADESWSLPTSNTVIGTLVADAFRARGLKFPPPGSAFGGASFFCAYLPRGPFLGTMPASLLRFGANLPYLKVLPVTLPIPPWPVGIMSLKNRTLTPVVQLFIDCAREVTKQIGRKS